MQQQQRTYIAIDLKSFYASVECIDRGLDPLYSIDEVFMDVTAYLKSYKMTAHELD